MANWDMFRELDHLRREIDDAFRGIGLGKVPSQTFLSGVRRFPMVNICEDDEAVYVDALVPGVDPSQVEMTALRNTLTLAGRRLPLEQEKNVVRHREERGSGAFSRTIELPAEVDLSRIAAVCRDGVLSVTLPKAEEAKPKKISVSVA